MVPRFCAGHWISATGGATAEWHAILAELEQQNCPDWLPPDRWTALLFDAENFLAAWGETAHRLGWTELDLFGVHPIAPAARFDVIGLIPVLNGAAVLALTNFTATMRRPSGAILSYQRSKQSGAIVLSMSGAEARG